ncbi:hypothetical protein BuS5_01185 [Desulfosarcina sp. BuS5]|nr:hypothetical protein BuS5_01185 [Desulfosarcina sp. BuS5]
MPYNCSPNYCIVNFIITMNYSIPHTDNLLFSRNIYFIINLGNPVHCFSYDFELSFNRTAKHFIALIKMESGLRLTLSLPANNNMN